MVLHSKMQFFHQAMLNIFSAGKTVCDQKKAKLINNENMNSRIRPSVIIRKLRHFSFTIVKRSFIFVHLPIDILAVE